MTPRRRTYHKHPCSQCGATVSTSSHSRHYVCASCRRAAGLCVAGKRSGGYTSLTVAPQQLPSFGTCERSRGGCGRKNQKLSNGRCEDCRFYGIPETDWILSAQGRHSRGGEFDFIKRRNR